MEFEFLDDHRRSLFQRFIQKETWTLTIKDFDFHSDDHFESRLFRNGLWKPSLLCVCVCECVCVCACVCGCVYLCMCVCVYACICVHVRVFVSASVSTNKGADLIWVCETNSRRWETLRWQQCVDPTKGLTVFVSASVSTNKTYTNKSAPLSGPHIVATSKFLICVS